MPPLPRAIVTSLLISILSGCGHRVVHVAPDESRPHITWEIRSGGDVGDAELVCGSVRLGEACVLSASTQFLQRSHVAQRHVG